MKLITKAIENKLPELYANEGKQLSEVKVILKLFTPDAGANWYITEWDGLDRMFGFCNLGDDQMAELGYVSLSEIKEIRGTIGLPVERDMYWDDTTTLDQVINFEKR